jgi:hypothetical protein
MQVPRAGNYKVSATGDTSAYINPQLLFGHGAPDGMIFELAGIMLGSMVLIAVIAGRFTGRLEPSPTGIVPFGGIQASAVTPFSTQSGLRSAQAGVPSGQSPSEFLTALAANFNTAPQATQGAPAGAAALGAPAVAADQGAHLDELSKLADLHDRGVLTDSEFAAEKAKILGT